MVVVVVGVGGCCSDGANGDYDIHGNGGGKSSGGGSGGGDGDGAALQLYDSPWWCCLAGGGVLKMRVKTSFQGISAIY